MATRTITLTFETEEQARRFDEAMGCRSAELPLGIRESIDRFPGGGRNLDGEMDLALAIEYLAARAINSRPFSGTGDPDAFPAKVEIQL